MKNLNIHERILELLEFDLTFNKEINNCSQSSASIL